MHTDAKRQNRSRWTHSGILLTLLSYFRVASPRNNEFLKVTVIKILCRLNIQKANVVLITKKTLHSKGLP